MEALCKLTDGSIVPYDMAISLAEGNYGPDPNKWEYLGSGSFYSIGGELIHSNVYCWFYRRIENKNVGHESGDQRVS
jgi:hypothetical protein